VEYARNLKAVFEPKSFQCTAGNFDVVIGDECVLYVRSETGIPPEACHGEAADCFEQAQAAGYATGSEPRESAIIVFDRVPGTALSVGHVGIVASHVGDQVSMHDSNWVGYHTIGDHTETVGPNGYAIKGYIYCAP
jgi:surface antigen